jgi:hypothetical protein
VLADKAHSSRQNRDHLAGRGIKAAIPTKDDQAVGRRKKGSGWPTAGLRQAAIPRPQHRGAGGEQAAWLPGNGNSLRQTRLCLPRHRRSTRISSWLRNPSRTDCRTRLIVHAEQLYPEPLGRRGRHHRRLAVAVWRLGCSGLEGARPTAGCHQCVEPLAKPEGLTLLGCETLSLGRAG